MAEAFNLASVDFLPALEVRMDPSEILNRALLTDEAVA